MKIGIKKASQGFTLIEVLIVLAISGFLMYVAVNFVSGSTQKAGFTVAINNFKQQIEQLINETSTGYYPNNGNYTCTGSSDGVTVPVFTAVSKDQGTNNGCIFLGKIIQFNSNGTQYSVYPVVGNEYVGAQSQSPTKIYDVSNGSSPTLPSLNPTTPLFGVTRTLQNGLTIVYVKTPIDPSITAVGFLAGDSSGNIASYSGSGINSGPEPLSLYYDSERGLGTYSFSTLNGDVQTPAPSPGFLPTTEVDICAADGSTRSGKIIIGGTDSSNLSVSITIYNHGNCT